MKQAHVVIENVHLDSAILHQERNNGKETFPSMFAFHSYISCLVWKSRLTFGTV